MPASKVDDIAPKWDSIGIRDAAPQAFPDPVPGQLRRGHERVVPDLIEAPTEHGGEGTQQVGGSRGGDGRDRLEGQEEPLGAFLAVLGGWKQGLAKPPSHGTIVIECKYISFN